MKWKSRGQYTNSLSMRTGRRSGALGSAASWEVGCADGAPGAMALIASSKGGGGGGWLLLADTKGTAPGTCNLRRPGRVGAAAAADRGAGGTQLAAWRGP